MTIWNENIAVFKVTWRGPTYRDDQASLFVADDDFESALSDIRECFAEIEAEILGVERLGMATANPERLAGGLSVDDPAYTTLMRALAASTPEDKSADRVASDERGGNHPPAVSHILKMLLEMDSEMQRDCEAIVRAVHQQHTGSTGFWREWRKFFIKLDAFLELKEEDKGFLQRFARLFHKWEKDHAGQKLSQRDEDLLREKVWAITDQAAARKAAKGAAGDSASDVKASG